MRFFSCFGALRVPDSQSVGAPGFCQQQDHELQKQLEETTTVALQTDYFGFNAWLLLSFFNRAPGSRTFKFTQPDVAIRMRADRLSDNTWKRTLSRKFQENPGFLERSSGFKATKLLKNTNIVILRDEPVPSLVLLQRQA